MSRPDSIRALAIYKTFTKQTEEVVQFLGVARHFQSATRLEIPKLKHASTDLARLLEDDLNDPDFDLRRREYLAKKGVRVPPSMEASATTDVSKPTSTPMSNPSTSNAPKQAEQPKPPPVDLIDFFESIEQNQQPMAQPNPMQNQQTGFQQQPQQPFYPQQTGFLQQPLATGYGQPTQYGAPYQAQDPNNPFGQQQQQPQQQPPPPAPLQAMPTGAGFGGYSPQPQSYGFQSQLAPIPQGGIAPFPQQQQQQQQAPQALQPQHTNPFRQSMLSPTTGAQPPAAPLSRQNTNPFARRLSTVNTQYTPSNEQFPPMQSPQVQPQPPQVQPIQPQRTGTNPFARASPAPQQGLQPPAAAPLRPNPTGSTNPFRQSQFINQQTGQGWQNTQSGTMGGLEQLPTVPVFPRPGMT